MVVLVENKLTLGTIKLVFNVCVELVTDIETIDLILFVISSVVCGYTSSIFCSGSTKKISEDILKLSYISFCLLLLLWFIIGFLLLFAIKL